MRIVRLLGTCLLLSVVISGAVLAQAPDPQPQKQTAEQRHAEAQAARRAALAAAMAGPADIALLEQGKLRLPDGTFWVPHDQAERLLAAWGNSRSRTLVGMVLGRGGSGDWAALLSYAPEGFVKDDEARDLNPIDVMNNLRQGAQQDNENRVARGFSPLDIGDWLQRPTYDNKSKRLIWAFPMTAHDNPAHSTVNYNTRALGRYGYFSLNLLTDPEHFAVDKPVADGLLAGLTYLPGKRYADFNAGTDHVAEYGLAALIGVVALKKIGVIALAGAFFLKFAKLGVLAVVGAGAAIRRFVTGRKKPAP